MKHIVIAAVLCAAQLAWAQSETETGGQSDGTTPAADQRPSEDELFGGSSPQAPEQSGAAEQRPSEEDIFGAPPEEQPGAQPSGTQPPAAQAAQQTTAESQEQLGLSGKTVDLFASGEVVENPLQIGALYYQRFVATHRAGLSAAGTLLSAPTLVDAYFDGRPNDRLRAMVVGRLTYDPTLDPNSTTARLTGQNHPNPNISLDQLWLRFDIARTVFVTAGRQHVKWGTARFWNPTDYLHNVRRDALALFDERLGTNMIKLHIPVEANGANFYAIGLLDNPTEAGTLGEVGGAARAEWVIGDAEIGVDALVQQNQHPKYGVDFSAAVGPFDIYAEGSLRPGTVYRFEQDPSVPAGLPIPVVVRNPVMDYGYSVAGGFNWTFAYRENDTATIGAEYFYNPAGYENSDLYTALLFNGGFQSFYTGQHYAALYFVANGPFSWDDTNFVLSNLANLSDHSYVSRLDFTMRVLTQLTVEANASVYYGNPNGEFRLRVDVPPMLINGQPTPGFTVPEQQFSLGLGLRLNI